MADNRESSLKESFASLLFKAKDGIDVRSEALELIPKDIVFASIPSIPSNVSSPTLYRKWLLSFSSLNPLFFILRKVACEKNLGDKWRIPLILDRIIENIDEEEGDNIFSGKIQAAVIFVFNPSKSGKRKDISNNKKLSPIAVKVFSDETSFASYPFINWISSPVIKGKNMKLLEKLESIFHNSSPSYSIENPTWMVKIQDKNERVFDFSGRGFHFPFYSSFSIPYIPSYLEIIDMEEEDRLSYLSLSYSRISKDKDYEICEKMVLDKSNNSISILHRGRDMDFNVTLKEKEKTLDNIFSSINFYSFHPAWLGNENEMDIDDNQPYVRTRFYLTSISSFGRKDYWRGFFTSYDLPLSWSEIADKIRDRIDFANHMESLDPSLSSIGRTTEDSVFACSVVFSSYSKEYTYIAPDDTYYPGMTVMVPVGEKNNLQVATVKSLHVFSKEKDKETIKKFKKIISHYPNKKIE